VNGARGVTRSIRHIRSAALSSKQQVREVLEKTNDTVHAPCAAIIWERDSSESCDLAKT